MKRIGLLGGMSWESSAEYYRLINQATRDRLGGLHFADCVMRSVDFTEIAELQRAGEWQQAGKRLAREAAALEAAGAELLVLLCQGLVNDRSRAEYRRIMRDLADRAAEGILLGCTEIDLLVAPADSPVPVFDTTRLHAERVVELALSPSHTNA